MKRYLIVLLALGLSGCANSPSEIKASGMKAEFNLPTSVTDSANCIAKQFDEIASSQNTVVRPDGNQTDLIFRSENYTAAILTLSSDASETKGSLALWGGLISNNQWLNPITKAVEACGGKRLLGH